MQNMTFDFLAKAHETKKPAVEFRLPLIKDWSFEFDYNLRLLVIPFGGHVKINLR